MLTPLVTEVVEEADVKEVAEGEGEMEARSSVSNTTPTVS